MQFYLGTHMPSWLSSSPFSLFVSHRRLLRYRSLPRAISPWCLDSGGFSELSLYGEWQTTAETYVAAVRRYQSEIGNLIWAAPQDWMCEPWMLEKTGLPTETHQKLTVWNLMELMDRAPELPWIPVLQGYLLDDYIRCIDIYMANGIDLWEFPVVGVGSVCRRQATVGIENVMRVLHSYGLKLHGFGVKTLGLKNIAPFLESSDSMAWSLDARRGTPIRGHSHKNCANCYEYAASWRDRVTSLPGVS